MRNLHIKLDQVTWPWSNLCFKNTIYITSMASIINPLTNSFCVQSSRLKNARLGEESLKLVPFLCFHSLYAALTSIKTALRYLPCPNYKNNNHLVGISTTMMISTSNHGKELHRNQLEWHCMPWDVCTEGMT